MDRFLDRVADALRGILGANDASSARAGGSRRPSGDADLDQAWEELDDFLSEGRGTPGAAKATADGRETPPSPTPPVSTKTARAYATLGVPVGANTAAVRAAYKKLMRQHHPDRFAGDAEKAREATTTAARINAAYEHIRNHSARNG